MTSTKMGNISVVDIKPKGWVDNDKILVYSHGGYTQLGANSTLGGYLIVANTTGLRIISIDYTLAPFSKWNQTTMNNIEIFGDSAGGGITLGSVLKMRDSKIGMPAAVVVFSPNTDLTLNGDTLFTLIRY